MRNKNRITTKSANCVGHVLPYKRSKQQKKKTEEERTYRKRCKNLLEEIKKHWRHLLNLQITWFAWTSYYLQNDGFCPHALEVLCFSFSAIQDGKPEANISIAAFVLCVSVFFAISFRSKNDLIGKYRVRK